MFEWQIVFGYFFLNCLSKWCKWYVVRKIMKFLQLFQILHGFWIILKNSGLFKSEGGKYLYNFSSTIGWNDANDMSLERYWNFTTFSCFKFCQIRHDFWIIWKFQNSDLFKKTYGGQCLDDFSSTVSWNGATDIQISQLFLCFVFFQIRHRFWIILRIPIECSQKRTTYSIWMSFL
jgi:hypothetical protein